MTESSENLSIAKRYLKAIESGAGGDEIAQFFAPEAIAEIYPAFIFPTSPARTWLGFELPRIAASKSCQASSMS